MSDSIVTMQVGERSALAQAQNSCVVLFASTTAGKLLGAQAYSDITSAIGGYYDAMTAFATTYSFAAWAQALAGNTFYLRPVSDLSRLSTAKSARMIGAEFHAFDFSSTAASNSEVGVEVGSWMPNFFRPRITVNGQALIFQDSAQSYPWGGSTTPNIGDLSMGLPLPYCSDVNFQFVSTGAVGFGEMNIYAPCGRITGNDSVQAYPVLAALHFVLNEI